MNTYEAVIVLKPILDVDNSDSVLKNLETLVETLNGTMIKKEKLGRKRLAYDIQKFKDGYITTFLMKMPAKGVAEFKRACHLSEDVLRMMLVRRDEYSAIETGKKPERPERVAGR